MKYAKILGYLGMIMILSLSSCNGNQAKINELEAQRDSLALAARDANMRYEELSDYLTDISECVDSVANQEKMAFVQVDPETGRKYTRTELRTRIADLGTLIDRQRTRIAALTDSINAKKINTKEVERLTQLVNYLNEQLAAKEVQMQQLQAELATSKRSIAELQTSVATAQAANEQLQGENNALDQMVVEKTNQLNQGWLLAKPKKELENMGVISGGNLLKKSKFNPGAVNTSVCVPIDIRTFTEINLNSKKKPVLLSQAPSSSYIIEEISKGNWKLTITDTMAFWSISKIVVIQLQ